MDPVGSNEQMIHLSVLPAVAGLMGRSKGLTPRKARLLTYGPAL